MDRQDMFEVQPEVQPEVRPELRLELRSTAEQLFADIRALTSDGVGVTRESYGQGESAAAEFLGEFARQHGLVVSHDRAANLQFSLPETATAEKVIWCGSHLDSVPQGGNYDGMAGIIACLLCLLRQKQTGILSPIPLHVMAFRGEESAWFGKAYIGSSALFGLLDVQFEIGVYPGRVEKTLLPTDGFDVGAHLHQATGQAFLAVALGERQILGVEQAKQRA